MKIHFVKVIKQSTQIMYQFEKVNKKDLNKNQVVLK
jgi:hypothetical protein